MAYDKIHSNIQYHLQTKETKTKRGREEEKKLNEKKKLSVLFRHHINGISFTYYIRYRSRQSNKCEQRKKTQGGGGT